MLLRLSAFTFLVLSTSQISQAAISNAPMYGKKCSGFNLNDVRGDVYFSNDCGSAFIAPHSHGRLTVANEYVDRSSCRRYDQLNELFNKTGNPELLDRIDNLRGADINFIAETGWDDIVESAREANPNKSVHKMNIFKAETENSGGSAYEIPGVSDNSENTIVGGAGGVMHLSATEVCENRGMKASDFLKSLPVTVYYTYRPYTDFEYTADFNSQYFVNDLKANVKGSFADFFRGDANVLAKTYKVNRFFEFRIAGTPGKTFTAEKLQEIGNKKLLQYLTEMAEFVGCSIENKAVVKNIVEENGSLKALVGELCENIKFDDLPGGIDADLKLSEKTHNLEKELTEIYCTKKEGTAEVEDKECKNAKAISKILMLSEIVAKADINSLNIDYKSKEHMQTIDYVESHQSMTFSVQPEN